MEAKADVGTSVPYNFEAGSLPNLVFSVLPRLAGQLAPGPSIHPAGLGYMSVTTLSCCVGIGLHIQALYTQHFPGLHLPSSSAIL